MQARWKRLLEEFIEFRAFVVAASAISSGNGCGFAFNGFAWLKERTVVLRVLFRYAKCNWFATLKTRTGIETDTVLARM